MIVPAEFGIKTKAEKFRVFLMGNFIVFQKERWKVFVRGFGTGEKGKSGFFDAKRKSPLRTPVGDD